MNKHIIPILVILLFIVSAVSPMVIGFKFDNDRVQLVELYPVDKQESVLDTAGNVDWWPMFHHDLIHSGYSTSTAPNTNNVIWSYTTGERIWSSPSVIDDKLYIGSWDNNAYCLDTNTGTKIWNYTTGDWIFSSPAIYENKIYIGSDDNKLYCLDALNGSKIWHYTTGDKVASSPVVENDRVYFGSWDDYLYCLNATNGNIIWKYDVGYSLDDPSPAVFNGRVYIGSFGVYCINATDGSLEWSVYEEVDWEFRSSPTVFGGRVYIGHDYDGMYCLDAYTGEEIWFYWTGETMVSSPAFFDGRIYFGSNDGYLHCLDAISGNIKWTTKLGDILISSPAVADGKIYVGSRGKMYCLLAANGNIIWSYYMGDCISSPAVADGKVYIGSYDNKVYCFGNDEENKPPEAPDINGTLKGKQGTEYNYTFTTIDPDGHDVYYYIDWNDSTYEEWIGPYTSGLEVTIGHNWTEKGTYLIKAKVIDIYGAESDWAYLEVTMPKNQQASNMWFLRWLERFPILQKILDVLRLNIG